MRSWTARSDSGSTARGPPAAEPVPPTAFGSPWAVRYRAVTTWRTPCSGWPGPTAAHPVQGATAGAAGVVYIDADVADALPATPDPALDPLDLLLAALVRGGVPVMLTGEARQLTDEERDALR